MICDDLTATLYLKVAHQGRYWRLVICRHCFAAPDRQERLEEAAKAMLGCYEDFTEWALIEDIEHALAVGDVMDQVRWEWSDLRKLVNPASQAPCVH
jgi:hypothetical protein